MYSTILKMAEIIRQVLRLRNYQIIKDFIHNGIRQSAIESVVIVALLRLRNFTACSEE